MTSSKLSDSEKQEIVRLYQDVPEETTITLAERFGVSSSTVRRILQSAVPKDIYDVLTHQKQRLHRTIKKSGRKESPKLASATTPKATGSAALDDEISESDAVGVKRRRRRSSATDSAGGGDGEQLSLLESEPKPSVDRNRFGDRDSEMDGLIAEEFFPQEEFSDFDDDEDYGDSETDEGDEEDLFDRRPYDSATLVKILPLTEASLPKICYLVIDRASELIVKPLKAFGELGHIPSDEIQEKTLPVFENHRVASRFSARNQRVFKVPDGKLLQKTAPYLQAKGITRLLIDGQVYRF